MTLLYKFLNWYTQHLLFPHRGWKYVQPLLRRFHLAKKTYTKKLFNGQKLYVNATDHIQKSIFWYGYYEKNVSLLWQSFIKEDSCVVDIGANIGYFSLLAATKAKKGIVYSFEPVSQFRNAFQKNILLNNLQHLRLLPFCVSDKNETVQVYIAGEDNLGMSSLQPPENYSSRNEKVQAIVFDDWVEQNNISSIDILKIDIEGAEKKALDGMIKTLKVYRPVIFIEIISAQLQNFEHSANDVYSSLYKLGYTAFEIAGKNQLRKISGEKEGYDIVFLPEFYRLPQDIIIV